jgi:hypothetical protein
MMVRFEDFQVFYLRVSLIGYSLRAGGGQQ